MKIYLLTKFKYLAVLPLLLLSVSLLAQGIAVTGKITDEKGAALPGVTVLVKGSTTGTTSDPAGNYSLNVPAGNETLVVSFIGYATQEVAVNNRAQINISLAPDTKALQEVVVVGYGTQEKAAVTGSIQTINAKELADIPVAQIAQKLQGKLAGVQITQTTGRLGEGMSVRIRGQASLSANSQPLYVVDGFPIVGNINSINPNEIETITVLKDASSTSLYGSRAAFGVVLITTKRAKAGQTNLSVNAYYGVQPMLST
jgi:TonB-dependent starch-binding outer membrane protein SusC